MKSIRNRLASRRGISILEVMISLALIAMVTAAAMTVAVSSIQWEAKYQDEMAALRDRESIAACVRYAESAQTLTPLLEKLGFDAVAATQKGSEYTYTLHKNNCIITLTVNFETNQYEITAADKNGATIY